MARARLGGAALCCNSGSAPVRSTRRRTSGGHSPVFRRDEADRALVVASERGKVRERAGRHAVERRVERRQRRQLPLPSGVLHRSPRRWLRAARTTPTPRVCATGEKPRPAALCATTATWRRSAGGLTRGGSDPARATEARLWRAQPRPRTRAPRRTAVARCGSRRRRRRRCRSFQPPRPTPTRAPPTLVRSRTPPPTPARPRRWTRRCLRATRRRRTTHRRRLRIDASVARPRTPRQRPAAPRRASPERAPHSQMPAPRRPPSPECRPFLPRRCTSSLWTTS